MAGIAGPRIRGLDNLEGLGYPELGSPDGTERVFALVTRDAIDQPRLGGGSAVHGRGLCVLREDGSIGVSTVPDDWLPG